METPFHSPEFLNGAFNCPYCGAFSNQHWGKLRIQFSAVASMNMDYQSARCEHCGCESIWLRGQGEQKGVMIYPLVSTAPMPVKDMPEDVRADFEEARNIVNLSPRAAAALLRLALQKLMVHLRQPGKNINADIAALVEKGLDKDIQKALDVIRVIGNESVHPGQLDMRDDIVTASKLFGILNYIVRVMITNKTELRSLYDSLPDDKKDGINNRDSK